MSNETLTRNEMYATMGTGTPVAAYIKTILGKVAVTVWDNILDKPVDVILQGNPKKKEEGCIVKVWSVKEDVFFKRTNARIMKKGLVIPFQVPEYVEEEKGIEQATDDELKAFLNSKFLALQNKLNKIDSVPVLARMVNLAEELEKSSKITEAITKRISELQTAEYIKEPEPAEEEV